MSNQKKFGFSMAKKSANRSAAIPPPPSLRGSSSSTVNKHGYSTMNSINATNATLFHVDTSKKRSKTEEEYFDEDDEISAPPKLEYIPAPGSPSYIPPKDDSSDSDDPLDAYMAAIEKQVKTPGKSSVVAKSDKKQEVRHDIESEDVEESYYRYMEENPRAGLQDDDSDIELEYDEDGNPIAPKKSKYIDPLPPLDHSTIEYSHFEKNFYVPHAEIDAMTPEQITSLRETLNIKAIGASPPNPVSSFGHFGFDSALISAISKSEYTQPTPIQAQAIPAALSGRDIIGIAKTGSGKTAAFLWPMLVHIMDQRELQQGDGPIGLILAPTRELSQQIYAEAKKFAKVYKLRVVCCYGGGSKWEQSKALEEGAEIVVATPGRMIDLIKMKATNLTRVTYLVLDEADRMFDMGFEPQVRSICDHARPDKQTLLFSATFKRKVEKLARDALVDAVRIVQGDVGEANTDVTQVALVMAQTSKMPWILNNLVNFLSAGSVLIFVTRKLGAEELANSLSVKEYDVLLLHGDMEQSERNTVITKFKKREVNILIATDVAARGLDIPHIRTVVNFDVARDIDTHTHRIGRTGRAGQKGTAYTLVTDKEKDFAGHLVRNLEAADQEVPQALMDLALQNPWFRKSRFKSGKGKSANVGGSGLGFKERPGRFTSSSRMESDTNVRTAIQKSGPGTDRLSALRSAFKAQYQHQFKASEDHTWEQNIQYGVQLSNPSVPAISPSDIPDPFVKPSPPPPPPPKSEGNIAERRKKRSRWDTSSGTDT